MDGLDFNNMTFESLLNIDSEVTTESEYPELDLFEAATECAEAEIGLLQCENALTMLEGAKLVKKAQSKKTKKKLKKSKMSAKAAKGRCKSGKVVKVTREAEDGSEEVLATGGTGPLPTTSDTGDLTQDDVEANKLDEVADATPDAEVTVTEIDEDDTTAQENFTGVEGEDYIVEYESAALVVYETQTYTLWEKIKDFVKTIWEKICNLWDKFIAAIRKFFDFNAKYFKAHKTEIAEGYNKNKGYDIDLNVSAQVEATWLKGEKSFKDIFEGFKKGTDDAWVTLQGISKETIEKKEDDKLFSQKQADRKLEEDAYGQGKNASRKIKIEDAAGKKFENIAWGMESYKEAVYKANADLKKRKNEVLKKLNKEYKGNSTALQNISKRSKEIVRIYKKQLVTCNGIYKILAKCMKACMKENNKERKD